jgi:hypothetical protein
MNSSRDGSPARAVRIEQLERRALLAGDFVFASTLGGIGKDKATDVAVDAANNAYVVGVYNGAVDFDPSPSRTLTLPFMPNGGDEAFVAKYSPTGGLLWAVPFNGAGAQECQSVALDADGNVIVTGWFSSTVDFNPSATSSFNLTSAGGEDGFVAKLTSNGSFVWAKRFGGAGREGGLAAAVDTSGNVYVQGMYNAPGDYNPGSATFTLACAGSYDVSLLKLDSSGNFVFAKRFGSSGEDMGNGLAVDSSGNVLSMGSFYGTVDFDPGSATRPLTAAGGSDIFVSKLSSSGAYVWAKRLGGSGAEQGGDLAVDASGNVYATGAFTGTADFNPVADATALRTSQSGSTDVFVAQLSSSGAYRWAQSFGASGTDKGNGLAVDSTGVYVTGKFAGSIDFNPSASATYTLASAGGSTDVFAMKLSTSSGGFHWARRAGGSSNLDEGEAIAVRAGRAWITGGFAGTVDFDPGPALAPRAAAGSAHEAFLLALSNA